MAPSSFFRDFQPSNSRYDDDAHQVEEAKATMASRMRGAGRMRACARITRSAPDYCAHNAVNDWQMQIAGHHVTVERPMMLSCARYSLDPTAGRLFLAAGPAQQHLARRQQLIATHERDHRLIRFRQHSK
jgi:hypothetical protein